MAVGPPPRPNRPQTQTGPRRPVSQSVPTCHPCISNLPWAAACAQADAAAWAEEPKPLEEASATARARALAEEPPPVEDAAEAASAKAWAARKARAWHGEADAVIWKAPRWASWRGAGMAGRPRRPRQSTHLHQRLRRRLRWQWRMQRTAAGACPTLHTVVGAWGTTVCNAVCVGRSQAACNCCRGAGQGQGNAGRGAPRAQQLEAARSRMSAAARMVGG